MARPSAAVVGRTPADRAATAAGRPARVRLTQWGYVVAAALAWLAATAWLRPLALPDEGRYVGVSWEMLRSGDWLVPALNGLPFFHKPPLFYWITAGSMALFGPGEMAARAASLLGAALATLSLGLFVRRWVGEALARRVLLVLVTTPLFFGGAQFANLDMLVAGCISATIVLAAHAVLRAEEGGPWRGALALAHVFAALGILAKGLIGGVLPALVLIVWAVSSRRTSRLRMLAWGPGLALFLLVAAPWFVLVQLRHPSFFHYFFVHQHLERFAAGGFNNAQPWWFYLPVLAVTTLPWFGWAARAVLRGAMPTPDQDLRRLMLAWLAVVVGFFSLPESKLVGYIFPALPPLTVLLALAADEGLARSPRATSRWRAWGAAAAAVCLAVLLLVQANPRGSITPLLGTVRQRWLPQDRLMMVDGFAYDATFYLRTRQPAWLVDTWSDPDIALHDNGRKAFHDAAQFATPAARARLIEPEEALRRLCEARVAWVIGKPDAPTRYPWLSNLERVAADAEHAVWRWDAQQGSVRGTRPCR